MSSSRITHPARPGRAEAVRTSPAPQLLPALAGGLAAGALSGIAASVVSTALRSPDAIFFNSLTITAGALAAGAGAGLLWRLLSRRPSPLPVFAATLLGMWLATVAGAFAVQEAVGVSGVLKFVAPLAAIVFGGILVIIPVLTRQSFRPMLLGPAAAVAAVASGIALVGQAQHETGRLALPDVPVAVQSTTAGSSPADDGLIRPAQVQGVDFILTPGASTATYTVREKLRSLPLPNDAVGKTNALSGVLRLDGRPSTVTLDLRTFVSDQELREQHVNEREDGPHFDRYPYAELTVPAIPDLPATYKPGETITRTVTGTMKMREVERPMTFNVEARLVGDTLYVLGRSQFTWEDFQMPRPNYVYVTVEDTVFIEVLLVGARSAETATQP